MCLLLRDRNSAPEPPTDPAGGEQAATVSFLVTLL